MALSKVFDLIYEKEKGGPAIDFKSDPEKLKAYFNEVLPEYDKNKVYISDIKKLIHWYNILQVLNLLVKEEPEKPAEPETKKEAKAKKGTASRTKSPVREKKEVAPKKKPSKPKSK
jgi:hypothetical protein